jgi:hypothetical protein
VFAGEAIPRGSRPHGEQPDRSGLVAERSFAAENRVAPLDGRLFLAMRSLSGGVATMRLNRPGSSA